MKFREARRYSCLWLAISDQDQDGRTVKLAELIGKKVVVTFFLYSRWRCWKSS